MQPATEIINLDAAVNEYALSEQWSAAKNEHCQYERGSNCVAHCWSAWSRLGFWCWPANGSSCLLWKYSQIMACVAQIDANFMQHTALAYDILNQSHTLQLHARMQYARYSPIRRTPLERTRTFCVAIWDLQNNSEQFYQYFQIE